MTIRVVYLDGTERIFEDVISWVIPAILFISPLLIQVKAPGERGDEYELYIVDQLKISFFEEVKP